MTERFNQTVIHNQLTWRSFFHPFKRTHTCKYHCYGLISVVTLGPYLSYPIMVLIKRAVLYSGRLFKAENKICKTFIPCKFSTMLN